MPENTQSMVPGVQGDPHAGLEQIKQLILQQLKPQMHPSQPTPRPGYGPDETKQKGYMMGDQGSNKSEIGAAMSNFGTFISNSVAQHKQNQVRDAAGVWGNLARAQENAQAVIGPPPNGDPTNPEYTKKIVEMMSKDPWIASNLNPSNPKAMKHLKNMQKAFDMNLLGEDNGDNVYREGLKQHFKIQKAFQRVKEASAKLAGHKAKQQQPQQQMTPEQQQKGMQSVLGQFIGHGQMQPTDPKALESMARIQEAEQAHRETLEFHKQAHLDQLDMQKQNLDLRREQMDNTFDARKATYDESVRHHKEMEKLTEELRRIERDKAQTLGDVGGLKDAVDRGMSIREITDSKSRDAVIKQYSNEGRRVPIPIEKAEQAAIDDASTQVAKIRTWQATIREAFTQPDGQLSNKVAQTLWDRVKYKFGSETPQSKLISDLSRERWAAIGGLVRGVRRGDILRDMVQHTPNPSIDSPKLMDAKLQALEANYSLASAVIYKEHGLLYDPSTGVNVDDEIKAYDQHLKAVKSSIDLMGKPRQVTRGADIP